MPAKVTRGGFHEGDALRALADAVDRGEVTDIVVAVRRADGVESHLELLREETEATYVVGLLEMVKLDLLRDGGG